MIEMRRIGASGADGVRPESGMPLWDRLAWALFVVAAALVIVTFTDYGVTWDEDVHSWYGFFVLGYYLSFFHDLRAFHWGDLYNYGAAFDLTAAVIDPNLAVRRSMRRATCSMAASASSASSARGSSGARCGGRAPGSSPRSSCC